MPFPISLADKFELLKCYAKPEKVRDMIVSSLNQIEGCTVRDDGLAIFFTCYGWFRKGRGDLADISRGKFSLEAREKSIVVEYQLSLLAAFLLNFVMGGLLFLSIVISIRKEFTSSPIVPPIVFLLWWAPFTIDYINKRKKIHRFLIKCAHDATKEDAN